MYLKARFTDAAAYWENRYQKGGNSGVGSYAHLAAYKADVINRFVREKGIRTVIEFGTGDGNQLLFFDLPFYSGYDVSKTAIANCRQQYKNDPSKQFALMDSYGGEQADLSLSLDVIYHLTEDPVYDQYMATLFSSSKKYVLIYSNNTDDNSYPGKAAHVKNRRFTDWVEKHAPLFRLRKHLPNKFSTAPDENLRCYTDFYFYEKEQPE
ncbi:MAG: hypothetical protein EOO14_01885 [Chitinophagaceae bacterium]|nr:MAG: hypothetical protein EOO14_01885 [Chitinophagaceae bacterium]